MSRVHGMVVCTMQHCFKILTKDCKRPRSLAQPLFDLQTFRLAQIGNVFQILSLLDAYKLLLDEPKQIKVQILEMYPIEIGLFIKKINQSLESTRTPINIGKSCCTLSDCIAIQCRSVLATVNRVKFDVKHRLTQYIRLISVSIIAFGQSNPLYFSLHFIQSSFLALRFAALIEKDFMHSVENKENE